ncbi:MAG: hypothetical protein J07HX5_00033 [halophilic archaeon J07HX5]|nr:MAG: hypothetical protein J07HX5_00033 [halophilic archaeon J07HX5]
MILTGELGFGESKSVGFDLSAGFESVTGAASVSFSTSKSSTGVEVSAYSGNDDEEVSYDFPIKRGEHCGVEVHRASVPASEDRKQLLVDGLLVR